jgi:uncharacterized protein with HEPN domain
VKHRDYQDFIQDILKSIDEILTFTKNTGYDDFMKNSMMKYAIIRCLEVIGEAAKRIPAPVRNKYADVPWKDMIAMRNKVIHEYFGVDSEILWQTIKEDIPALKKQVQRILEENNKLL